MDDGTTGEMAGRDKLSGGKDWHPKIGLPKGEGAGQSISLFFYFLSVVNQFKRK